MKYYFKEKKIFIGYNYKSLGTKKIVIYIDTKKVNDNSKSNHKNLHFI